MFNKGEAVQAIQVCYQIEDTNFDREYDGLREAMRFFNLSEGTIVTLEQRDSFEKEGHLVELVPAHEYMAAVRKE